MAANQRLCCGLSLHLQITDDIEREFGAGGGALPSGEEALAAPPQDAVERLAVYLFVKGYPEAHTPEQRRHIVQDHWPAQSQGVQHAFRLQTEGIIAALFEG